MTELTNGRVLTATEAADLVGLTPSAVSHHLRALEKYGIAERADPVEGGDARTRPWRSRYRELNFDAAGPGATAASEQLLQGHLTRLAHDYLAAVRSGSGSTEGREFGFTVSETWLTTEERLAALDAFAAVVKSLPHRHAGDHPADATPIQFTIAHVPPSRPTPPGGGS
jgi:DNA-binding transcriptional ArsR family regulator